MTGLCVSIFVHTAEQARRDMALAAEAGADVVELRLDGFTNPEHVEQLLRDAPLPTIATCRCDWEDGESRFNDSLRAAMLDEGVDDAANYIDFELYALKQSGEWLPRDQRPGLIVSHHDFTDRPDRLFAIVNALNESDGDIVKIAWLARSIRDNLEAFELLLNRQKPMIAICMGEAGLLSRVLAKKFGAFLTYASLRRSDATAPGQPTIDELKRIYRWDAINADTHVYGVVGSPIAHSLSPLVHNAGFAHAGENAVYLPMLVNPGYESFKAFMEESIAFVPLDLRGLSITIPHKENAFRYLREKNAAVAPLCERIGAVNTIRIRGGELEAFNTDHDAILDTICDALHASHKELADLRIAVIGAGGTARTAVAALANLGATVVIYNRTKEKAEQLARDFDGRSGKVVAARLEKLCDSCCHVFINTTPVGMHPNLDASPLGEQLPKFTPQTLVFDTIYNPSKTKLLMQAEEAGTRTVGGMEMFIKQAARQFEIWTGKVAPESQMREATIAAGPIR